MEINANLTRSDDDRQVEKFGVQHDVRVKVVVLCAV